MSSVFPVKSIIQSKGRLLDISIPVVMGILNATPDSFYNKGKGSNLTDLLLNTEKMLTEGAAILDIGGASTKPGQLLLEPDEELFRVMTIVNAVHTRFPEAWISIDTYNSKVAREVVNAGVSIVNDISAGVFDENMLKTVADLKVPYIAMHIQGTPETMQLNPTYTDVVKEVRSSIKDVCTKCHSLGIDDVIIDPGFGFGKTLDHNFKLLKELHTFRILGRPILAGLSRKSMIFKTLKVETDYALNGTTALNMMALMQGANILRVHDVKEAVEVVELYKHCM